MSTTATYEIAETDELEALGRDDITVDTSAALAPDEPVHTGDYDKADAPSRTRCCLVFSVFVIALAVGAAVVAVLLTRGSGGEAESDGKGEGGAGGGLEGEGGGPKPVGVDSGGEVKTYTVQVRGRHPHDAMAFTQGFEFAGGVFYESTGLRGQSSLRKVEIKTGKVLQRFELPDMRLFGEGMTLHTDHHIFMLTWQAGRGFVFNQSTFEVIKEWSYDGEGWGLCMDRDRDEVYMSDGTHELRVLDPNDLSERRRVPVTVRGRKAKNLNELEWVCGEVWANVWMTHLIYRIDPQTGVVKSIIDASALPAKGDRLPNNDVLNGIAFDRQTGRLWFTGKKWPAVYEVTITDDSLDLTKCK
eukprot:GFKZ01006644.1.p1 GENE.GFKZ01006644.1~~GFKZ01006644.1.p1  ORF type:complete len:371 (-),score=51.00 GFKZ01006644.1:955-2028(-)